MPNYHGNNQHGSPIVRDEELGLLLQSYADRGIKSWEFMTACLLCDREDITKISRRTLGNLLSEYKIITARRGNSGLTDEEAYDFILDELNADPVRSRGPAAIQERLQQKSIHIPVNFIKAIMKAVAPEGFVSRNPFYKSANVAHKGKIIVLGPNEKWAGDGHEKLVLIGFPIYGVRDYWGRILGYWIVPNARNASIVDFLYLKLIDKYGGVPICLTLDKGTETTKVYARQTSFRQVLAPDILLEEVPACVFVKSIWNIVIERSWKAFWNTEGKNILAQWNRRVLDVAFNEDNHVHRALADWIWVPILQAQIDNYVTYHNDHQVRFQSNKAGPSGCSPNFAFEHPERFGGTNQLIRFPNESRAELSGYVSELMEQHDGRPEEWFYPLWFNSIAHSVFREIGSPDVSHSNAWEVWQQMLLPVTYRVQDFEQSNNILL